MLRVSEIFVSVQGETTYMGYPTIFVRLQGCNLNCKYCDTQISNYVEYTIAEVVDQVEKIREATGFKKVCITGGEPLLHEETHLVAETLSQNGFVVIVETNGTLPLATHRTYMYAMDIKTECSKQIYNLNITKQNMLQLNHWDDLIIVYSNLEEAIWGLTTVKKVYENVEPPFTIFLSAVYGEPSLAKDILNYLIDNKEVYHNWDISFQVQMHKVLDVK